MDCNSNKNNIANLVDSPNIVILIESHNIETIGTRAGPTGGAGVAFPASRASLITLVTATTREEVVFSFIF